MNINIGRVRGLPEMEMALFTECVKTLNSHSGANAKKKKYYEGHIMLSDVNLGIALPDGLSGLQIGCEWGTKAVDVLAARSMFDGFVGRNGEDAEGINAIASRNNMLFGYIKACRDELKYGCTFATLSADPNGLAIVRFHSPETAAALWDGEKNRIRCGFAVIETITNTEGEHKPSHINFYTDTDIWELRVIGNTTDFNATRYPHIMGRPLMEPLVWNATSNKPFGRSRLKFPIRELINGYVRTICNASIGLEFSTAPQKYLLGVTDEQYDALINQKFKQYVGNLLASTTNPESGEKPSFGQLPQGSITPHVEMMRLLATQFSAASGLSITDTGVVNDANPSSSDAILAQSQTLCLMAEELNAGNGNALQQIAWMATAIERKQSLADLSDEDKDIVAHFKNPAMPSLAVTTDAAIKIASVRQGFADTDIFLEMIGFSQADIRRINAQESKSRGMSVLGEFQTDEDSTSDMA